MDRRRTGFRWYTGLSGCVNCIEVDASGVVEGVGERGLSAQRSTFKFNGVAEIEICAFAAVHYVVSTLGPYQAMSQVER